MEAGRVGGAREADVAPAPDAVAGRSAGTWTPANPAPLGLAGFALTTFILSLFNTHVVAQAGVLEVGAVAIAYGGIAQLLAGMWEFRTGNTFGAVAFSSYGAFWISFYFLLHTTPAIAPKYVAIYLYAWGIFTGYMFIASLRTTGAVALVFALLTATYFLLAIGAAGGHLTITKVGGWVGIATAIAAWYASFAQVINSTFGRTVLPLVPLSR
jgi:succinate-acetate transporter protein